MEFYAKTRQNGKSVVVTIPQSMRIDVGTDVYVNIRQVKDKDTEKIVKSM
jgi:virulence-associated protein VagC